MKLNLNLHAWWIQVQYLSSAKIFVDFFPASAEVSQKALRLGPQVSPTDVSQNARNGFNQEVRKTQSTFSVITHRALSLIQTQGNSAHKMFVVGCPWREHSRPWGHSQTNVILAVQA